MPKKLPGWPSFQAWSSAWRCSASTFLAIPCAMPWIPNSGTAVKVVQRSKKMRGLKIGVLLLAVVMLVGLWAAPSALAEEKPRRGGMLRVALAGDPPSLDMHQEQTFLVTIPFSTVYNTLVVFDPHGYPNIIGDLAKSWTVSDDKMSWTFTLHQGVTFHDGSGLTSADIKASWDKIIAPPEGVVSARKSLYQATKSIETPDPYTVVFRLHYPSPSFLSMLAHPANFIS